MATVQKLIPRLDWKLDPNKMLYTAHVKRGIYRVETRPALRFTFHPFTIGEVPTVGHVEEGWTAGHCIVACETHAQENRA